MDRGVRRATVHRVAELYVTKMTKHTPMLPFQNQQINANKEANRGKKKKEELGKIKIEEGRG